MKNLGLSKHHNKESQKPISYANDCLFSLILTARSTVVIVSVHLISHRNFTEWWHCSMGLWLPIANVKFVKGLHKICRCFEDLSKIWTQIEGNSRFTFGFNILNINFIFVYNISAWNGVVMLLPLLGAFLADSFGGRTIVIAFVMSISTKFLQFLFTRYIFYFTHLILNPRIQQIGQGITRWHHRSRENDVLGQGGALYQRLLAQTTCFKNKIFQKKWGNIQRFSCGS